ncbi:unnamed protein product [Dovyalis caffra]|uniref:Uncharacterized protein n=1 Tax=Dovyalis caffra TaxID=77055 RepID=A0AAV1QSW9_9ROSI|nr:unnamed protein product [Dovyalis caffra]
MKGKSKGCHQFNPRMPVKVGPAYNDANDADIRILSQFNDPSLVLESTQADGQDHLMVVNKDDDVFSSGNTQNQGSHSFRHRNTMAVSKALSLVYSKLAIT